MESLKEFNYYDVNGKQIKNPDHTLQYDKDLDKLIWFDAKNSPAATPVQWRVAATNPTEQEYLNKELERGTNIGENQIATPEWLAQKQEQAQQKQAAVTPTQDATDNSQKPATIDPNSVKSEIPSKKSDEMLIVDNLVSSGTLQKEVTKAVVNTENIPILTGDIPEISAAISKALKAARKSGLFSSEFLSGEGEVVNAGQARDTTAGTIMSTVLNDYLSVSKSPKNKSLFTYTFLPEGEPLQEKGGKSKKKKKKVANTRQSSPKPAITTSTAAPQTPSLVEQPKPPLEDLSTQKSNSVTLDEKRKKELETVLKNKITEMLSDTLESFKSTATSVKFHCVGVDEPSQAEAKEPKETPNLQPEEPVRETKEPVQKTEEATHSNDYYIFTRLVEAEEGEETTTTEGDEPDEGAVSEDTGEESVKELAKDIAKEDKKPGEVEEEAPVFPTTEALKTLIEGLNKAGNSFETDLAVYTLSYTLEDVNTDSLSFDILVESKKTTPKEGFWESFGKALKAHLKKAGAQIADTLGGGRGQMD